MTSRAHLFFGLICLAAALGVLVLVAVDTDTGLIEKVRRRVTIGDALAPTVAACFVALGGLMLITVERRAEAQPTLNLDNLRFLAGVLLLVVVALLIMRWAGPALFEDYRLLRATVPWKWTGFLIGGTLLVTGLIAGIERRLSARAILVGVGVTLGLIALFDLPFSDLLLPPNGDV